MTDSGAERAARRIVPFVYKNYSFDDPETEKEVVYRTVAAMIQEETGTQYAQFAKFAGRILESQRSEAGDLDGAFIEECLIECGLYKPTKVTKPCGANCQCAEFGFPTTCNKLTDAAREALAALPPAPEEGETK
jgi:hypothetical protein